MPEKLEHSWEIIRKGVALHAFPGAVAVVTHKGKRVLFKSGGYASLFPAKNRMHRDTIFDLASITKPVATATSIMILIQDGKLDLESRVCRIIPSFSSGSKKKVTVKHLLTHSSGLPAWKDLYSKTSARSR